MCARSPASQHPPSQAYVPDSARRHRSVPFEVITSWLPRKVRKPKSLAIRSDLLFAESCHRNPTDKSAQRTDRSPRHKNEHIAFLKDLEFLTTRMFIRSRISFGIV